MFIPLFSFVFFFNLFRYGEQNEQPFKPNDNITLSEMLKARMRDFTNPAEVNWLYYEISNIELDDMKQVNQNTNNKYK